MLRQPRGASRQLTVEHGHGHGHGHGKRQARFARLIFLEPPIGLEPTTYGLRNRFAEGDVATISDIAPLKVGHLVVRLREARQAYLMAVEAGSPYAHARGLDLAELEHLESVLADEDTTNSATS